ncbi:MAG: FecR domain-containing protein [Candidatus Riflebacteria bacterium]|nr:FecR domain-containing protein [Candidatus Riflebacteria bacterium]
MRRRSKVLPGIGLFLALSQAFCPGCAAAGTPAVTIRQPFGELFLYGQIALEPGGGRLFLPKSPRPLLPARKPVLVPTGSRLETGPRETAALAFGGGSRILVGPGSRLVIRRFSVELGTGTLLLRHHGSAIPLKVTGSQTLLVQPDSLVELQTSPTGLLVRVQVGEARIPDHQAPLRPGAVVQVRDNHPAPAGSEFPLVTWEPPAVEMELPEGALDEVFGKIPAGAAEPRPTTPAPAPTSDPAAVTPATDTPTATIPTEDTAPPAGSPPSAGGVFRGGDDDF